MSTADRVKTMLAVQWKAMQSVVPKHMKPERLARVALTSINRTPRLAECTPESLAQAIMDAATLGLEVNDGTGRAYLVPYKNKIDGRWVTQAQLQIGYPGLVELAYRSGMVQTIYSYAVFDGDEFRYSLGLNPDIHHVPAGEPIAECLTHVYAVVKMKDGGFLFEVMMRSQIDAIKQRSKTGKDGKGPWATDYVEMARKTGIRRVCKMVPKSVELQRAVRIDEEHELGPFNAVVDVEPVAVRQLDELADRMEGNGSLAGTIHDPAGPPADDDGCLVDA